jgi:hypothetical protein
MLQYYRLSAAIESRVARIGSTRDSSLFLDAAIGRLQAIAES